MSVRLKKCPRPKDLSKLVPHPAQGSNKYTRGKLVIVGGSEAYPGAACLASLSAYRMGAGYVQVVCAPETLSVIRTFDPNVVARSWEGFTCASAGLAELSQSDPRACLVGSGMGGSPSEVALALDVLRACTCPVVVDGGATTALATEEGRKAASMRAEAGLVTVVTPHFGEAARLGDPIGAKAPKHPEGHQKQSARFAQQLADAYGATIVLKGADTFLARTRGAKQDADDVVWLMQAGTAALAKAGTGDVLAGMVGALLAQGMDQMDAAKLATSLHAEAGRCAAARLTDVSVMATDVAQAIPEAISRIS